MSTVTIETIHQDIDAILRLLKSGEEIILTEYDKPIGRIIPEVPFEKRKEEYLKHLESLVGVLKGKATDFEREPDREL